MTIDSLGIVWKLPNTINSIDNFRDLHEHGEKFFSNLILQQVEESQGEYEPEAYFQRFLHRQSLLLLLYAFLESHLFDLCDTTADHFGKDTKINDFDTRDRGIKKCKKYLENIIGLSSTMSKKEWKFIVGIQVVRNTYIHRPNEIKRLAAMKVIEESCGNSEALPADYIKKSIDVICIYLTKLEGEIVDK